MSRLETKIFDDDIDVNRRLAELDMDKQDILDIRDVANSYFTTGLSPFFLLNSAGLLAYHWGTRELRATFLKRGWRIYESGGIGGVRHSDKKIIAIYQNVNKACNLSDLPQPRSRKGPGSENLGMGNLFDGIEENIPSTYSGERIDTAVWYVMVDPDGAVEVTHAIVSDGEFSDFIERIFIHDGRDLDPLVEDDPSENDAIDQDFKISRK